MCVIGEVDTKIEGTLVWLAAVDIYLLLQIHTVIFSSFDFDDDKKISKDEFVRL